jgi:hypothetical protein
MTTMIAGGVILIIIWRVTHITDNALMFIYFIGMSVKCPHCPVTERTDDETYYEEAFKH